MFDYPDKPKRKRKQSNPYSRRFILIFGFVVGLFVAAIAFLGLVVFTVTPEPLESPVQVVAIDLSATPLPYNYGMSPAHLTATENAIRAMLTPEPIVQMVTPPPPNCYWVMATADDPIRESQLRHLLDEAGYTDAIVTVRADGEDYVCGNGQTREFHMMVSVPTITVPLDETELLNNTSYLGNIVAELMAYVTATNPHPPIAAVIIFIYGNQQRTWNASLPDAQNALGAGESGAALWFAGFMGE